MKTHTTVLDAEQFVAGINLAGVPTYSPKAFVAPPSRFVPKADEHQSIVVGAEIQAFAKGVDEATRRAVSDSVLCAQLVAKKQAPDDYEQQYRVYVDTLSNLGWLIEDQGFTTYNSGTVESDVNAAVLDLAAALMGPASTAFLLVKASLDALKKLGEGKPAITIFRRESQHQKTATFQVSVVEKNDDGRLRVSLMAFRLHAEKTETQVLFFKFRKEGAHFEHASTKVSVYEDILTDVSDRLHKIVETHVGGYVDTVLNTMQL